MSEVKRYYPTITRIQAAVCEHFDVRPIEMKSRRRSRCVARPRQVAMYLSRELTPHSFPEIGRMFGRRDHTTVMHGVKVVESLIASDRAFAALVGEIRAAVDGDPAQTVMRLVA